MRITNLVSLCTSLSFCPGWVTGGQQRVIWEEGWCETQWERWRQTSHKWHVAECWPNSDNTRQNVFPRCPLHPSTSPQGRAVSQRPSSLSPSPSHPLFRGILSSTHLSIWHIRDKQIDTCTLTHTASQQSSTLFDPSATHRTQCIREVNLLYKKTVKTKIQTDCPTFLT